MVRYYKSSINIAIFVIRKYKREISLKKIIYILLLLFSNILYSQQLNKFLDLHECGLDFTYRYNKITNRDTVNVKNVFEGAKLPLSYQITEIPEDCKKIVGAYVWFSMSDPIDDYHTDYVVKFTNPNNQTKDFAAIGIGKDNGVGWFDARTYAYRADVSELVVGNGSYTIDFNVPMITQWGVPVSKINGAIFMVIYKDNSKKFQGHLVIYDGIKSFEFVDSELNLTDLNVCEATNDAKGFFIVSDVQKRLAKVGGGVATYDEFDICEAAIAGQTFSMERHFYNVESRNISLAQNQNNIQFAVSPTYEGLYGEKYSWDMIGTYYRTQNCFACTNSLNLNSQVSDNQLCSGESATITISLPPEFENENIDLNWTSNPAGFTSKDLSITVKPNVNTTYIIDANIGNGCFSSHLEFLIKVDPPFYADAGPDKEFCVGMDSVEIGGNTTGGELPYSYEWIPSTGMSQPNIAKPKVKVEAGDLQYVLKVTDNMGCISYDTVNLVVHEPPKPIIQVIGDPNFCACDSVEITTVGDYESYLWSNGLTSKTIKVNQPGDYSVTVVNSNNCSATSEPVTVNTFQPETTVSLNDTLIIVQLGEKLRIPMKIIDAKNLDECHVADYQAVIKFNKTALVPVDGTPFGTMDNMYRYLTLTGEKTLTDSLNEFTLQAVLGVTDYVDVELESFEWTKCKGINKLKDSAVKIVGLCYSGGTRYFDPSGTNYFLKQNYPNPATNSTNIEFGVLERGNAVIVISDIYGREIKNYELGNVFPGKYTIELNAEDLSPGTYIYSYRINGQIINRVMSVSK